MYNNPDNKKTPKPKPKYNCEKCRFTCSKKSEFVRHLNTAKHKRIIDDNTKDRDQYRCECGKIYKYKSGLCKHKKSCNEIKKRIERTQETDTIENTLNKEEITSMFMFMIEKYNEKQMEIQEKNRIIEIETNRRNHENTMEIVNKVLESMPKAGNTTNNTYIEKQTLNFYLTNTCKEAESIHDFTDRYVKRCVDFFQENYLQVAYNEVNLASNIYTLFFNCLEENPQNLNFVQTTDAKNGILYVKEKKKNENRELHGEAEFIKYMDGFEKAGLNICHAINRALNPLQSKYEELLQEQCGPPPCEEDYEDEEQFEQMHDRYKEKTNNLKCNLMMQIFDTARLFDDKQRRNEILSKTKRLKE